MMKRKILLEKNLIRLLQERNLSLSEVSKRLNINKSTLQNYRNGALPQGLQIAVELANFFEVSLDELVFGKDGIQAPKQNLSGRYEILITAIDKLSSGQLIQVKEPSSD